MVGGFGWTRKGSDGKPVMHKGIDWLASPGDPIFAAHDGDVTRAGEQSSGAGYGQRLYLSGKGVQTRYAHMSVQFVILGQWVRAGHCLGLVGRSGNLSDSIPSHLHFEVFVKDELVNPVWWVHGTGDRMGITEQMALRQA